MVNPMENDSATIELIMLYILLFLIIYSSSGDM